MNFMQISPIYIDGLTRSRRRCASKWLWAWWKLLGVKEKDLCFIHNRIGYPITSGLVLVITMLKLINFNNSNNSINNNNKNSYINLSPIKMSRTLISSYKIYIWILEVYPKIFFAIPNIFLLNSPLIKLNTSISSV